MPRNFHEIYANTRSARPKFRRIHPSSPPGISRDRGEDLVSSGPLETVMPPVGITIGRDKAPHIPRIISNGQRAPLMSSASRACPNAGHGLSSRIYPSPLLPPPSSFPHLRARTLACVRACEWFTREAKQPRLACRHALVALPHAPPPLWYLSSNVIISDFHAKFPRLPLSGAEKSRRFVTR